MNGPNSEMAQGSQLNEVGGASDESLDKAPHSGRATRLTEPEQSPASSDGSPLDIETLRHPAEYSRLILAVSASIIGVGVLLLIFVIVYSTSLVELAGVFALLLLLVVGIIWLFLIVGRARLLGNCLFVSHLSLPQLQQVVDTVRNRVGYSRRVDIYVSDSVDHPVTLATFMGTRILILKAGTVADLETEDNRQQLEFVLGSVFGALKARHRQFILLSVLLEFETKLKVLNVFLTPYFRATVYTGDQIGAACCGSVTAALAAMNRLMVGKELASNVALEGVLNQAVKVRKRLLPRLGQLDSTTPHLTNRYLNLLAFMASKFPEEMNAYVTSLDSPSRELLAELNDTSIHGRSLRPARAVLATAALVTVSVLALLGLGMSQWRSEIVAAFEPAPTATPMPAPTQEPAPAPPEPTRTTSFGLSILLSVIPNEVEPCQETTVEAEFRQGVREISCSPSSLDSLHYVQYESEASMREDYLSIVPTTLPGSDCSAGPSSLAYNFRTSSGVSDLSCYENQGGSIVFVWTSKVTNIFGDSHLLGICTSRSLDYPQIYAEWRALISRT